MRRTLLHLTAHRHRRETGYTLVETLIAILLMAVVVMSVFSMALTSRISSKKTSKKMAANIYSKTVEEKLKSYVTGDTDAPGPSTGWKIQEDTCVGCTGFPDCFALQIGCTHNVTDMLPAVCTPNEPICSGAPVNATLTYTVANQGGCVGVGCRKRVEISIEWTE